MKRFSIATLQRFSDIKAHTFRAWEQRYNFLKPARTPTNHRYYTIENLSQLLNLALLKKGGYNPSQLDKLGPDSIRKIISELTDEDDRKTREINKLIVFMFSVNTEEFEETLDTSVYYWGTDSTIEDIIVPFLDAVKLLSYNDSSNEIHFAVTAIRKKLILGIEKIKSKQPVKRKALFFLPQNEHFDLVLLYMNYILKRAGFTTLYMGTNIPIENLESITVEKKPDLVFTYLTPKHSFQVQKFAKYLKVRLPESTFIVSGLSNKVLEQPVETNVKLIGLNEMKKYAAVAGF